ncbi:MAG: AAA family ATPase [Bacteroidales bacterium]|nr:AAA family ATPase [Bacteroidales bacterium]
MITSNKLVGRLKEQQILQECVNSNKAELIAVYGRRRVGKTFLIKKFFKEKFDFYVSGVYDTNRQNNIKLFLNAIRQYSNDYVPEVDNWIDVFEIFKNFILKLKQRKKSKHIVIFIDELPWFDNQKSNFFTIFGNFWNSFAVDIDNLKLIVCGSATTWMVNKLFSDKGGLHNRVTRRIFLTPFSLKETEEFLLNHNFDWDKNSILKAYMILGGIPFYLSLLKSNLSLSQNVDSLFFNKYGELKMEYDFLFNSLFNNSTTYQKIIELLADRVNGLTRKDIITLLKIPDNGTITEILNNLVNCNFLEVYNSFGNYVNNKIYRLIDLYSFFYIKFVAKYNGKEEDHWSKLSDTIKNNWYGYAFEQVCFNHINQIKQALGLTIISTEISSWYYNKDGIKAQIDLIIDRKDNYIDLCEIKYSSSSYILTKDYSEYLEERKELFRQLSKTSKSLRLVLISNRDFKENMYTANFTTRVNILDLYK